MKKLRKLLCLLLAAVMVLSMSVMVYAEQTVDSEKGGSGTITINNATKGKDYSVYKLFDLTYDSATGSYAYKVTDEWKTFFTTGAGSSYVTVDSNGYVTWTDNVSTTTSKVQELGQLVAAYATDNNISATVTVDNATDTTIKITNLELGYYLVTSEVGSLVELNTVTESVEIVDKNAKPTITKLVSSDGTNYADTSTAGFADTVYYKITITGIDEITDLILHDYLPTGFNLDTNSFSVKLYNSAGGSVDLVANTDYVVSTDSLSCISNCSFEINFANLLTTDTNGYYASYVTSQSNSAASYIVVTYTVTVDFNAQTASDTNTPNTNYAWVSHSNTTSEKETTNTYIYNFYVYKYTSSDTPLSGAKFILYKIDGSNTYYAKFDSDGNLTGWVTTLEDSCYLTSDSDGFIHFNGLDEGIYYLEETTAPNGYALLGSDDNPITVTISSTGVVTYTTTGNTSSTTADTTKKTDSYTIKVINSKNSAMPTTGGIGTTIFYIVGCILVLGAVVLLITRRRMNNAAK